MLSTFNLPGKNVSPDRQMAMMRTYLTQLKDEIESELYNVKWENLSKPLQDKINSLEKYQADSDDKINFIKANYVETDYLRANYITAQQISASYASISYVQANYADIGSLNAVSAAINTLSAKAITTDNLSAQTIYGSQISGLTISASQITSGKINAAYINTQSFSGYSLWVATLIAAGLNAGCDDTPGPVTLTPKWVWFPSYNRYMLCSAEQGRLG